jgi:membrane-bound lytic murein transglycosylase D
MSKSFRTSKLLIAICLWAITSGAYAQATIDIPNSVQFGGIQVNLDKGAKEIINTDVKSLMTNKRFWDDKMDRAVLYFPIIEGILIEQEVPIDFKYLAVQESSLNPDAISASNAIGFWQFKKETAVEMGIRVDNEIDERKSISASTLAAARYLKRSNRQYNNWVSSLFSYYLGLEGVKSIIPTNWTGAREIVLTAKTDRYVLRFFAHKIALEAGLDSHRTNNTIVLLETSSGGQTSFAAIAKNLNIDELELKKFNRWANSDLIPVDKDYPIAVPVSTDQINSVRDKLASVRQNIGMETVKKDIGFPILRKLPKVGPKGHLFYEINGIQGIQARADDSPSSLAKAARTSVAKLMRLNDQTGNDPIVGNEIYYLAKKSKKAKVPFHTVRTGETLRGVSQIYGIRLKNLLQYNRITNRNLRLQTGRVLYLTEKRPRNQPVEIIDQPQFEERNDLPVQPAQPVNIVSEPVNIPQNASERKKYTPKLVDQPAATSSTPVTAAAEPVKSNTKSSTPSNDRIVILAEGETVNISTKNDTWKEETKTTNRASNTKPAASTSAPAPATPSADYHTVSSGQTYYSISRLHNLTIDELLSINNLTANDKLSVGQRLKLRSATSTAAATNKSEGATLTHVVVAGETMFRISQTYKVSIDEIKKLNNLQDNTVKVGQKLLIPKQ